MSGQLEVGRRKFITVTVAGGAGVGLGLYFAVGGERTRTPKESWSARPDSWVANAWLRLDPNGVATVRVNHSEMGQGVTTGLPTILAEELDIEWNNVRFEIAPVEQVYKNPMFMVQMTGGSTSTPSSWSILREAGAVAREMLVRAAARALGVAARDCRTSRGFVIHDGSNQRLPYGQLVEVAASVRPPAEVELKEPSEFRLIGTDVPRLDVAEKVDGAAVFGIDVQLPGLLNATVIHAPVFGDRVKNVTADAALAMPGVHSVLPIEAGVAVVADTWWHAARAAEVVEVEWHGSGHRDLSSAAIWTRWGELAASGEAKELAAEGDVGAALAKANKRVQATYRVPFEAHATPEPMNCTAHAQPGRCRIWAPTQNQDGAQEVAARITGLRYTDIDVVTTYLGGGFGRRGEVDYVAEAVELSLELGAPVKVIWSREEDMARGPFRPASLHVLEAGLDADGALVAWSHRIVGPDPLAISLPGTLACALPYGAPRSLRDGARRLLGGFGSSVLAGMGVMGGAAPVPYRVPHLRVDYVADDPGIPVTMWRGVGNTVNGYVVESFIDEVAAAAGRNPVELRTGLLVDARRRAVLELAVGRAGVAPGPGRGVAVVEFHDALVAMVADVVVEGGQVVVQRVVCAVDCGRVINPRNVRAQVAGGVAFGLTAALKGDITIDGGRVMQSNFDDFPILTMREMPEVEVHLVPTERDPVGIGEAGVPPIAPAVANAVFAATGNRTRALPIRL